MDKNRVFLLTREQKKALKTQKIINNLGAKAVISPLCVVRKKTINLPDFNLATAFIFTSSNSFDLALLDYWRAANKKVEFLIIGTSFAKLLDEYQICNYNYFDSAQDLINYLQAKNTNLKQGQASILYYFRGNYSKYDLKLLLDKYQLIEKFCYDIIYDYNDDLIKKIKDSKITDILFFSLYNAKYFFALLMPHHIMIKNIRIYGLSKEIADFFRDKGFANIHYPKTPNLRSLIEIL